MDWSGYIEMGAYFEGRTVFSVYLSFAISITIPFRSNHKIRGGGVREHHLVRCVRNIQNSKIVRVSSSNAVSFQQAI